MRKIAVFMVTVLAATFIFASGGAVKAEGYQENNHQNDEYSQHDHDMPHVRHYWSMKVMNKTDGTYLSDYGEYKQACLGQNIVFTPWHIDERASYYTVMMYEKDSGNVVFYREGVDQSTMMNPRSNSTLGWTTWHKPTVYGLKVTAYNNWHQPIDEYHDWLNVY